MAVMLLVVAESSGSSPGRRGHKMAIGSDGELCGTIGGGVMEIALVEKSKSLLGTPSAGLTTPAARVNEVIEQVHRPDSPHASGMICSGRQSVIFDTLTPQDIEVVDQIIDSLERRNALYLSISSGGIRVVAPDAGSKPEDYSFSTYGESGHVYLERLGKKNDLYIVGGGHCALALSELMSKMDFHIRLFDDRPGLDTVERNTFADEVTIVRAYEQIGDYIPDGPNVYVAVMTLGYRFDDIVIRALIRKQFKYFGVLGSKAKMATLLKQLKSDGLPGDAIDRIKTPIGLPIESHTPEEIALSVAAEIVSVKNT